VGGVDRSYGEVHKAVWKGTEVAVKVIAAEKITKDMEKSFQDEVRVMTSLRHPNVVLFMAASTKPPKMCIVMEYMALGSLYDVRRAHCLCRDVEALRLTEELFARVQLLHNELVPEIPFQLKAKMAYQASKGMHFLHSSGTPNLLRASFFPPPPICAFHSLPDVALAIQASCTAISNRSTCCSTTSGTLR
jgi:serine/threonine protein kinase